MIKTLEIKGINDEFLSHIKHTATEVCCDMSTWSLLIKYNEDQNVFVSVGRPFILEYETDDGGFSSLRKVEFSQNQNNITANMMQTSEEENTTEEKNISAEGYRSGFAGYGYYSSNIRKR